MKKDQEKATRYGYDLLSRPTSTTDPLGRSATTEHEPFCRSFAHTSARGKRTSVHFDSLCRMDRIANEEGDTEFSHDEWGRVVEVLQPTGTKASARYGSARYGVNRYGEESQVKERRTYEYDERNLLVATTFPDGRRLRYERDAAGRVSAVVGTYQDVEEHRTDYTYLNDGRLWTVTHAGQTYRYEYGSDGRLQFLHYPARTKVLAEYSWDEAGNLLFIHYRRDDVSLHKMEYLYDPSGNRTHFIDTPMDLRQKVTHEYRYDRLNRLRKVYHDGGLVSAYGFDHSDNRSEMSKMVENAMRSFIYEYDAADQLLGVKRDGVQALVFQHDADGNMTEKRDLLMGRTDSYAWNSSGRLTATTLEERLQPSRISRHEYDAGQIRKLQVGHDGARIAYYYSGLAPLLEKTERPPNSPSTITYVAGHHLLGLVHDGQFRHLLVDALGSVRTVLDSKGVSLASFTYSEYGSAYRQDSASALVTCDRNEICLLDGGSESGRGQLLFTGGHGPAFESGSRLTYMGLRWYDDQVGRFISRDLDPGARTEPATLNSYSYAWNNPVVRIDPIGLAPFSLAQEEKIAKQYVLSGDFSGALELIYPMVWTDMVDKYPVLRSLFALRANLGQAWSAKDPRRRKTGTHWQNCHNVAGAFADAVRAAGATPRIVVLRAQRGGVALRAGSSSVLPEETMIGLQHIGMEFNGRVYDAWMPLVGVPSSDYRQKYMDGQELSPEQIYAPADPYTLNKDRD